MQGYKNYFEGTSTCITACLIIWPPKPSCLFSDVFHYRNQESDQIARSYNPATPLQIVPAAEILHLLTWTLYFSYLLHMKLERWMNVLSHCAARLDFSLITRLKILGYRACNGSPLVHSCCPTSSDFRQSLCRKKVLPHLRAALLGIGQANQQRQFLKLHYENLSSSKIK